MSSDVRIFDIVSTPPADRTLEQRLTLLEKDYERLREENYFLRMAVEGSMSLGRKIEKCYEEMDKLVTWHQKVLNQNSSHFIKK